MTAMAYTILKLHAGKLLKSKDMDSITDYLQVSLMSHYLRGAYFSSFPFGSINYIKTSATPTTTSLKA